MKKAVFLSIAMALLVAAVPAAQAQPVTPPRENALQFRVGGFFPAGDSAFWNDVEDLFTMKVGDFDDVAFGITYVASMNRVMEVGFNLDFYDQSVRSAYRDFLGQDEFGTFFVEHDTRLQTIPLTADIRFLPAGRGGGHGPYRARRPIPYVGFGAGFNFWQYEEEGEFWDFLDPLDPSNRVLFFDRFRDDGVAFETHVLAGVELPLGRSSGLLFEGRYSWSDDELGGDFEGLGKLDMSGFWGFVGASFRF